MRTGFADEPAASLPLPGQCSAPVPEPLGFRRPWPNPPGFTDSPAGTTPDQGRRKRRANGARLLSPFLQPRSPLRGTHVSEAFASTEKAESRMFAETNWI